MDNRTKYTRDVYRALFLIIGIFLGALSIKWTYWEYQQQQWADNQVPMLLNPLADTPVYAREAPETPKPPTERELVIAEIERVFGDDADDAVKVARCESGLRANAVGPTQDYGVFQIHQPSHKVAVRFLLNYKVNIEIAHQLYLEQGWTPWRSSAKCSGLY